jgi:hypothetical protein
MEDLENRSSQEQSNSTTADYAVGKWRPPLHTRFKPGQSGHPTGRPKGSKNESTILRGLLHRKITIREGGKSRRVTILEAILTRIAEDSLKGDVKSAQFLLNRYSAMVTGEVGKAELSQDDREVLQASLKKMLAESKNGSV